MKFISSRRSAIASPFAARDDNCRFARLSVLPILERRRAFDRSPRFRPRGARLASVLPRIRRARPASCRQCAYTGPEVPAAPFYVNRASTIPM